jgi:hypothetical protein
MEENYVIESVPVLLENGEIIYVEARNKLRQEVANKNYSFEKISKQLEEISEKVRDAFQKSKPDKVNVELGFELSVESGELCALLVKGSGKANLKINLEWNNLKD